MPCRCSKHGCSRSRSRAPWRSTLAPRPSERPAADQEYLRLVAQDANDFTRVELHTSALPGREDPPSPAGRNHSNVTARRCQRHPEQTALGRLRDIRLGRPWHRRHEPDRSLLAAATDHHPFGYVRALCIPRRGIRRYSSFKRGHEPADSSLVSTSATAPRPGPGATRPELQRVIEEQRARRCVGRLASTTARRSRLSNLAFLASRRVLALACRGRTVVLVARRWRSC